jgi:hypothetical protein
MILGASEYWPVCDKADPSDGWPIMEVQQTPYPATRDWYGKLFFYIHNELSKFLERLGKLQVSFNLYNVDVKELPLHLEPATYARIEVCLFTIFLDAF